MSRLHRGAASTPTMRAAALVFSVPVAALVLAASELTRVPYGSAGSHLRAFGEIARSAVDQLGGLALVLVLGALVLAAMERAERPRWVVPSVALGAGLAVCLLAHLTLAEHPPFAWHPLMLLMTVLFGALVTLSLFVLGRRSEGRARRVALVLGALGGVGSLILARAHYLVLVGQYPTLHAWFVRVAFVGLASSLALLFRGLGRAPVTRSLSVVAVLIAVVAVASSASPAVASPGVLHYTELGRGASVDEALRSNRAALLPSALPAPRTHPAARADPDALARFRRHGGLPDLDVALAELDVLLVLIEATRYDRTSLARGPEGPTPTLLRLAERSHWFERAYSAANGTFAAVASILAMTPASYAELDIRPRFWRGRLRESQLTAPELFSASGRDTFWVGHDHRTSFSRTIEGLSQGFRDVTLVPQERGQDEDADARIADAAIARWGARRGRTFGLVFFASPHDDYQVHYRDAPRDTELERYDQELRYADEQLGRLLEVVDLRRTVVIVAGDHGEAFGEHGYRHHLTSLYDEQIHVPLVVHVPGASPARHTAPTSVRYVFPWLLLRGSPEERAAAEDVLVADVGPMLRATDGAVLSEMIGPRRQEVALIFEDTTVIHDVLASLTRVYLNEPDPGQLHDVREARPDHYRRALTLTLDYRNARFAGQRFRFTP